jgi:acyl-coenzyme A thioesterase PaaI-like protein
MLLKETALLRLLGLRIPTLLFLGPRVERLDEDGCEVLIPFNWRTGNHLIHGMYFGALCAGADLAAGLNAARLIFSRHRDLRLVFGDLHAEFLKRADGDVLFRSRDGRRVEAAVREAVATGERVTLDPPIEVVALVPRKYGEEPVARFRLTLSLKRQGAPSARAPAANGRASAAG